MGETTVNKQVRASILLTLPLSFVFPCYAAGQLDIFLYVSPYEGIYIVGDNRTTQQRGVSVEIIIWISKTPSQHMLDIGWCGHYIAERDEEKTFLPSVSSLLVVVSTCVFSLPHRRISKFPTFSITIEKKWKRH